MNLREFLNALRIVFCMSGDDYLACINAEDREYLGDDLLLDRFIKDRFKAFVSLPDQDQERIYALILRRNKEQGVTP